MSFKRRRLIPSPFDEFDQVKLRDYCLYLVGSYLQNFREITPTIPYVLGDNSGRNGDHIRRFYDLQFIIWTDWLAISGYFY